MHWLFIHQNAPGQWRGLIPALLKRGHAIHLIGARSRSDGPNGIQYLHYDWSDQHPAARLVDPDLERNLQRASRVAALCTQLSQQGIQPDVVVFHSAWGEGLYLRDLWPKAVLIAYPELYAQAQLLGHGFDPDAGSLSEGSRRALRRQNFVALAAIADSDAAIAPTLFQRDTFPPHLRSRFQVIHEGVDLEQVRPYPRRHLQLTQDLMLRKGDPVITYVSRSLEPLRGFRVFMRALPAVLEQHPTAQVLIVGSREGTSYCRGSTHPDGYWGEMTALLGDRLDRHRVHCLGRLPYDQYLAVLQVSAVHVHLTYPYAMSWSLLEAMACGAVVVGSANAPVDEVIRQGENGYLVPFSAHDALSNALLKVLADPAAYAAIGQAARRTVEQRYGLSAAVEAYEQLASSLSLVG